MQKLHSTILLLNSVLILGYKNKFIKAKNQLPKIGMVDVDVRTSIKLNLVENANPNAIKMIIHKVNP